MICNSLQELQNIITTKTRKEYIFDEAIKLDGKIRQYLFDKNNITDYRVPILIEPNRVFEFCCNDEDIVDYSQLLNSYYYFHSDDDVYTVSTNPQALYEYESKR